MKLVNSEKLLKKPMVWLEIDTQKIQENLQAIKNVARTQKIMAVLKANAYGMGGAKVAEIIEDQVDMFGVVGVAEALALRATGITKKIVNLGMYSPDDVESLMVNQITPTIFTEMALRDFETQARNRKTPANIWIKIDTGLGRLGVCYEQALSFICSAFKSRSLSVEGIYSTFSEDATFDREQLGRFLEIKKKCENDNVSIPLWSIASSSALCTLPESYFDVVRTGIPIFGYYPSKEAEATNKIKLQPAVTYKTRVACIKELEPGESIFYRRRFIAKKKTRVAVLLPGYSYGLDPRLAQSGKVLIREKKYPLIGGISATNCFANIGMDKTIEAGDEVVIFGKQGEAIIGPEEITTQLGQNLYEILSRIPEKVTRIYIVGESSKHF